MEAVKKGAELDTFIDVNVTRGEKYFTGVCDKIGVVTQGRNMEELKKNLREAIDLSLEDGEYLAYGLVEHPEIILHTETGGR